MMFPVRGFVSHVLRHDEDRRIEHGILCQVAQIREVIVGPPVNLVNRRPEVYKMGFQNIPISKNEFDNPGMKSARTDIIYHCGGNLQDRDIVHEVFNVIRKTPCIL